ncbi:cell wall-binding repeat-containing protein [Microbacterium esteraromaticum]|nr:cell wall-binding repeat-containing protein [Microbacterium esteraromaticum]
MHLRRPRDRHVSRTARWATTIVAVLGLILGTAVPATAAATPVGAAAAASVGGPVKAALAGFSPGNIISDAVFTDRATMTEAQIQTFFNSKVKTCRGGSDKYGPIICLKDYKMDSVNRPADAYCKGYTGARGESAARIIYRVAQSCGINPQVLIVMLQKEQGLVTHTWPSKWRYDAALGQACPDTAPCDPKFVGFFHQIYGAARQMQIYMEGRYFQWYKAGKTWQIQWHPDRARCGTGPVYIANKATEALYYYTPYQPNAAAMRAGYGTGDSCSSYGNRNFYNYFTDWFGSTQKVMPSLSMKTVAVDGRFVVGQALRATAAATPAPATVSYQWYRNGSAISGATASSYTLAAADGGTKVHVTAVAKKAGYKDAVATSAATAVGTVTVSRLAGRVRETTAIEVSRAAWPSGASTVMLATSLDYPDALSAAAAAGKASASLLLTPAAAIPAEVTAEIKRLNPTRIVLVGGTGVLSAKVAAQAAAAAPAAKVQRVSGATRYATSRTAAEMGGQSAQVLIATGRDYPDALSAAAVGNSTGAPVLLVDGAQSKLDAASVATLRKIGATSATIVGGTGVVSAGVEKNLRSLGISVTRISGADRYATNDAVAKKYFPSSALKVLFASGSGYADALSASVLAGRWSVPLLLTRESCIVGSAAEFMRTKGTEAAVLIGGEGVLGAGVAALRRC